MIEYAKARYRDLLRCDSEANRLALLSLETVLAAARESPAFKRASGLVPHNLLARQVWLWRLNGTPYQNPADWFPAKTTSEALATQEALDRDWVAYLEALTPAELARVFEYTASDGTRYRNTADDVLTHVFNHATYHRGQIARIVHELGGQRASTDYIALTRVRV